MNNFNLKKYLAEGKLLKEEENLEGKTINLVRTLHTTGKYNNETGKMDKVTQTKNMTGTIGDINSFSGSTGFWLTKACLFTSKPGMQPFYLPREC